MRWIARKLKRVTFVLMRAREFLAKDRSTPWQISMRERIRAWRMGFLGESLYIYSEARRTPEIYLTDWERFIRAVDINGAIPDLLDDKLRFRKVFGLAVPVLLEVGVVDGGMVKPSNEGGAYPVERLLDDIGEFVAKPVSGGGGGGIMVFEKDQSGMRVNGEVLERKLLLELLSSMSNVVLQERINSAEYAEMIYPDCLNTVRLLTMYDAEKRESFVAAAIHRFGTSKSFPVDNWTQGGLSVGIDLETGEMGKAATYPVDGEMKWYENHPETGGRICGVVVPRWQKIVGEILKAASVFSHLPYIGWDIVVQDSGYLVLEANSNTDVNLLQIHSPLLCDQRVRKFYERHHVLRRGTSRRDS